MAIFIEAGREGLGRGRFPGGIPGKRGGARKSERFCTGRAREGRPERRSAREKPRSRMGRPSRRGGRECRTVRICKTGAGSRGSRAPRRGTRRGGRAARPTWGGQRRETARTHGRHDGMAAQSEAHDAPGRRAKRYDGARRGRRTPRLGGAAETRGSGQSCGSAPYFPRAPFTASGNTSLKPSLKELGTTMVPPVSRTDS